MNVPVVTPSEQLIIVAHKNDNMHYGFPLTLKMKKRAVMKIKFLPLPSDITNTGQPFKMLLTGPLFAFIVNRTH